jgi:hypothetical protein
MDQIPYVVRCTAQGCHEPATYKIAAEWSDGTTKELKTYGLACESHLQLLFRRSRDRQRGYRLAEGESLGAPAVFRIEQGRRDRELVRMPDLEASGD